MYYPASVAIDCALLEQVILSKSSQCLMKHGCTGAWSAMCACNGVWTVEWYGWVVVPSCAFERTVEIRFPPTRYTSILSVYFGGFKFGTFKIDWLCMHDNKHSPHHLRLAILYSWTCVPCVLRKPMVAWLEVFSRRVLAGNMCYYSHSSRSVIIL